MNFAEEKELPESFVDVTGTVLTPGRPDICKGNGETYDENGKLIECCCDACNWLIACIGYKNRHKRIK